MTTLLTSPIATATESSALAYAVADAERASERLGAAWDRAAAAKAHYDGLVAKRLADRTPGPRSELGTAAAAKRSRMAKYLVTEYTWHEGGSDLHKEWPGAMPKTLGEILSTIDWEWTVGEDGWLYGPWVEEQDDAGRVEGRTQTCVTIERMDGSEVSESRMAKILGLAGI